MVSDLPKITQLFGDRARLGLSLFPTCLSAMSPGFRYNYGPLTSPSVTGDAESWVIYTQTNFILVSHLVLNLWPYNPNGWTDSAPSRHGLTSDSPQSISGVKLQRLHRPQHLAQPPPHSILTTTYVTKFTAHTIPPAWPFSSPRLPLLSVPTSPQVALPTWLMVTSLLRSYTPCCLGHSPGSRHLGSVMLLILSYVSLTSLTRLRRLKAGPIAYSSVFTRPCSIDHRG